MTDKLKRKCELLIKNRESIMKGFKSEQKQMGIAAGLLYAGADMEADVEKLKVCMEIMEAHTEVFSGFRKDVKLALLSKMAMSEDPEKYIADVVTVSGMIGKGKKSDNAYTILAAMLICDQGKQNEAAAVIERYEELMGRMEKTHPILTSSEDISYAMLLALSGRNIDDVMEDMEEAGKYLKENGGLGAGKNALQGLSEVLALTEGDMKNRCDRLAEICRIFKEKKLAFGKGTELGTLVPLLGIDEKPEVLVDEIIEAEEFLKKSKDFDGNSAGQENRLMFAAILVAECYGEKSLSNDNAVISNAVAAIKTTRIALVVNAITNILPGMLEGFASAGGGSGSSAGSVSANSV